MLLQKIITILTCLVCLSQFSYCQTDIDNSIILTGIDSIDKQILNLGEAKNNLNAIRLEDVKYGKYNFANASGSDTIFLTFKEEFQELTNGDLFYFNNPSSISGAILLSVQNDSSLIPLMLNTQDTVDGNKLIQNQIIGAIYYNHKAFIITPIHKTCPPNFVKVNDNYCIEMTERTAVNFFDAGKVCIESNASLCSLGEWYYACKNTVQLGLTQMINNFEWLDDATNDVLQVKLIGNGTCEAFGNAYADTGIRNYRCCYRLK